MHTRLLAPILVATFGVLVACTVGGGAGEPDVVRTPVTAGELTAPDGMTVDATIASATLGDECGGGGSGFAAPSQDCAPASADAGAGGCGAICRPSSVQLSFKATGGTKPAKVEILSVKLHTDADGKYVDELSASAPTVWNDGYAAWDETISPGADLKASYTLSAPKWSTYGGADARMASTQYHLLVTVRIDGGGVIVLKSAAIAREPEVVT